MKCTTENRAISFFWRERNRINLSPPYQREAGVWSLDRKQLFIDSLLNGFDIPKLYVHDVSADVTHSFEWAVVDGKQRLGSIWSFMEGEFCLADDFSFLEAHSSPDAPQPGQSYSEFTQDWKDKFRDVQLSTVVISNATEEDIEEMFFRLNNGEKLNAAESRNALGGELARAIADLANNDFFRLKLGFENRRYSHREVAAKFLAIEDARRSNPTAIPDLKKRHLDALVRENRGNSGLARSLVAKVSRNLATMSSVFDDDSPDLGKQSYPQLMYLFVEAILRQYGHPNLREYVRDFIPNFRMLRMENLQRTEDERDTVLIEFGRLMQQGTNDSGSMHERLSIMVRHFLATYPDVKIKDGRRFFNSDERYYLWTRAEKRCEACGIALPSLEEVDADHIEQWAHGGTTTLRNARSLCITCNRSQRRS